MSATVTEQSVRALLTMGQQLEELTGKIHQETAKLKDAFEENQAGLGPHSESIQKLIEDVEGTESDAAIPVKKLVLKLQRAAVIRQGIIEKNRYTTNKGRSR